MSACGPRTTSQTFRQTSDKIKGQHQRAYIHDSTRALSFEIQSLQVTNMAVPTLAARSLQAYRPTPTGYQDIENQVRQYKTLLSFCRQNIYHHRQLNAYFNGEVKRCQVQSSTVPNEYRDKWTRLFSRQRWQYAFGQADNVSSSPDKSTLQRASTAVGASPQAIRQEEEGRSESAGPSENTEKTALEHVLQADVWW